MRFKTANEKHHLKVSQRPLLYRFDIHALKCTQCNFSNHDVLQTGLLYSPTAPLGGSALKALRFYQHSLRTQEASLYWLKFFVRWFCRSERARHSREWGATTGVELLRAQLF